MKRTILVLLAIPLLIILLAVLLVPLLIDKERLLAFAADTLQQKTGATLAVAGDVDLSLFPTLGVALGDVSVTMPDPSQPGLSARSLVIGVQVMPLLRSEIAVDTLKLDGLLLRTVTDPAPARIDTTDMSAEELAAFYERRDAARAAAGRDAGERAALAVPLALNVARLTVTDSRLEITEAGGSTDIILVEEFTATGLNLAGRAIPLAASIVLYGDDPVAIALDGEVSVDQSTQVLGLVRLSVTVEGLADAAITLETSGQVDLNREIADLELSARLPDASASGQLRYAAFESPQIDATLHLDRFTRALLALGGPDAAAAGEAPADTTTAGDTALPLDAIRRMDTRAQLTIEQVNWDAHRVDNLEARLRVVDGVALLHRVTGTIHGGQLAMKANLNAKQPLARVNTQGSLSGVDIAAALAAAEAQPVLTGSANLEWKLTGSGNSTAVLTDSLRGPITLVAENAVLVDLGVEQMLCEAIALVNQEPLSATFPTQTPFETLSVDVNLADGEARLQPLRADLGNVRLNGSGALVLASMDFDATFKARVSAGLGKLDPACRVNQRITDIAWPVNCTGNVAGEPSEWCAVDTADILEDLATNELKRKAQKEIERKFGEEAGEALKQLFGD